MRFKVTPDVLIPRPETEILCENAVNMIRFELKGTVLDLCTGSGCIAVSVAKYTRARVTAADISTDALDIARENAAKNMVRIDFVESDMFENINGSFDIITSNPPYIPTRELQELMPDVKDYEPRIALNGGADGLKFYRKIAQNAPSHLNPGGALILEIGCDQADGVTEMLSQKGGFNNIRTIKDYAGLDRVIIARIN